MTQTFFLGANSRNGFASLYPDFPGDKNIFLHIIKGGPGTGKSAFMKRIGRAAEEQGLEVQYVLCSGDPDSLDGVCVPARQIAWVDGTAPHVGEPGCFGVDSDYVNLGSFCHTPFRSEDREVLRALSARHRGLYREITQSLAQAEIVETGPASDRLPALPLSADCGLCLPQRRYLHAISCRGECFLWSEIKTLCKQVESLSVSALQLLSEELEKRKLPAVRCPSPLDASQLEAILLPWMDCAFVANTACRGLEDALSKLREAKAIHDEMEALIHPYVDFDALTAYTEKTVRDLCG